MRFMIHLFITLAIFRNLVDFCGVTYIICIFHFLPFNLSITNLFYESFVQTTFTNFSNVMYSYIELISYKYAEEKLIANNSPAFPFICVAIKQVVRVSKPFYPCQ